MTSKTNAIFLSKLLVQRGLVGAGAEIGVFEGAFTQPLLNRWALGAPMHLVDLWDGTGKGGMKAGPDHLKKAQHFLRKHTDRVVFHAMSSAAAAEQIPDDSLMFVYIDALHTRPGCFEDMELWWPKLKKGGLFAGHDYRHNCGVPRAVMLFATMHDISFTVVPEAYREVVTNAIWYLFKE